MQDADGKTALCRAVEKNHIEAIKLLLPYADNDLWETTLVSAVKSGQCTSLKMILDTCNSDASIKIPILHLACKLNCCRRIAEPLSITTDSLVCTEEDRITTFLVENLHLNVLSDYNEEGYTPILLAAHFGFPDYVKYLLSTSKNVEYQLHECTIDDQLTIFHLCAQQDRQQSSKYLPVPNTETLNSTDTGHAAICQFILDNYRHTSERLLYEQDSQGSTPLHLACQQCNLRICEIFIKYMDKDKYLFVEDSKQRTPLHICAQFGNRALLQLLLPDEIDKNIARKTLDEMCDLDGRTPLRLACIEGEPFVVKAFLTSLNEIE